MPRAARSAVAAVVVVVVVLAGGWAARSLTPAATPGLAGALAVLPQETGIVGFTDWSRLSDTRVPFAELGERDVATRSELYDTQASMAEQLGWSVLDARWEVFGQTAGGSVLVVQLDGSVSGPDVADGLEATGFERTGDRWTLGSGLLRSAGLSTLMQNVRVLDRERLVVMSDAAGAIDAVEAVVRSGAPAVTRDRELVDVATALAGSQTALLERQGLGCATTAMPDEQSRQQAAVALDGTEGLTDHVASGRGLVDSGGDGLDAQDVVFALRFADPSTAREQARVREVVSSGAFIGRSGTLDEALRIDDVSVDGATTSLRFGRDPGTDVVMTGQGPLLFASC